MSFFVSKDLKDIIDEKTYLSQEPYSSSLNNYVIKSNSQILASKKTFETISFNEDDKIESVDFFLNASEMNNILFASNQMMEILDSNSKKHTFLLKLLKIAKIDDDKYYCQYKILGENHD